MLVQHCILILFALCGFRTNEILAQAAVRNNDYDNISAYENLDYTNEYPQFAITGCALIKQRALNNPNIQDFKLKCDEPDSLDSFPRLDRDVAVRIKEVFIRKQPRLKALYLNDLKHLRNVLTFSIVESGLKFLEISNSKNVFEPMANSLRHVELTDNEFAYFDWRWFTNFRHPVEAQLANNPLQCNCSLFWLAKWSSIIIPKSVTSPLGGTFNLSISQLVRFPATIRDVEHIVCRDDRSESTTVPLTHWAEKHAFCDLPNVDMSPKIATASVGDSQSFSCMIQTSSALNPIRNGYFNTVNYNVIDKGSTIDKTLVEQISTREDGTLQHTRITVKGVSSENMGWYICVGMSDAGPSFDVAALSVEGPPKVTKTGFSGPPQPGREISFSFEIFAYPAVNISWSKNDEPVPFNKSLPYFPVVYYVTDLLKIEQRLWKFYLRQVTFHMKHEYYTFSYYKANYSLIVCNSNGCDDVQFGEHINESYWPKTHTGKLYTLPPNPGPTHHSSEMMSTEPNLVLVTVIVVCASFGLTVCSISIVCLLKKRKNDKVAQNNRRSAKDLREMLGAADTFPLTNYSTNVVYQPVLSSDVPLIQRENVELIKEIGEGAFGKVYSAAHLNSTGSGDKTSVAVKCLKNVTVERCEEFAREAELMAKLKHPHIVTFYGVCLENAESNLLLLFEFMDLGDLKHFLAARGPNPELIGATGDGEPLAMCQLISVAKQVALGLNYLHQKHFVHRDLACRNCLCQSPLIVKLSDFGMSRDIYSSDYYRLARKAPLPVRWLPPESLVYGKFTSHSDIWSYGVVLWEVFSHGVTPWCQYSNMEVLQQVTAGNVLTKPDKCLDEMYDLMLWCWKKIPQERPTSQNILDALSKISITELSCTLQATPTETLTAEATIETASTAQTVATISEVDCIGSIESNSVNMYSEE